MIYGRGVDPADARWWILARHGHENMPLVGALVGIVEMLLVAPFAVPPLERFLPRL